MSGICDYGTRGTMHNGAAIVLKDSRDDLALLGFKLGLTENHRDKKLAGEEEEDYDDLGTSFDSIEDHFQQILSRCKSNVLMELMESFHGIKSNLMVSES